MNQTLMFILSFFLTQVLTSQTSDFKGQTEGSAKNRNFIIGFVFDSGNPIKNAKIKNMTTEKIAFSDKDGRYKIEADVNDELKFSFLGMKPVTRIVLESSFSINVSLEHEIIELESVTVATSKELLRSQNELSEAYDQDKEIIRTAFGFKDSRQINYALPVMSSENLNKGTSNFFLAINGLFRSLRFIYGEWGQITGVNLRNTLETGGAVPAVYDIDGIVYEEPPVFLSVSEIDRVALLYPGTATAMYGIRGGSGVVVVNTKGGNFSQFQSSPQTNASKYMVEKAITEEEARRNWPDFLKTLYKSNNVVDAKKAYDSYVNIQTVNTNFIIDACMYFMEYWPDDIFTHQLITESLKSSEHDSTYLKAMAFLMDNHGETNTSVDLYQRLLVQNSNAAQSYRDLANAYIQANFNNRGINLYARYFNLVKEGFFDRPPEAFENVINTEVNAVLGISDEVTHPLLDMLHTETDNITTRVLLEWSDDSAILILQFVSQLQGIDVWTNATGNENEFKGYTSKEFLVYGNPGSWQINVEYKGNDTGLSTYLKMTISSDYGTMKQSDRIKLFRLDIKGVNRRLVEIPSLE